MLIHHFRNEEGTGVETRSAVVSGIVNGARQSVNLVPRVLRRAGRREPWERGSQSVSYWPIFSPCLVTVSEVFHTYIHEQLHTQFTGSHCDS